MKKQTMWWVLVAVAVVIALWLTWGKDAGDLSPSPSASSSVSKTPSQGATATPTPQTSTISGGTTSGVAYTTLVKQYAGRRIQFGMTCQAEPESLVLKNGTTIMLDNRSGDARKISVGGTTYSLSGYGYQLVTLRSSTFPKTYSMNCGAAVNVGKIILEQ